MRIIKNLKVKKYSIKVRYKYIQMATLVREYILDADDKPIKENINRLRNATRDRPCQTILGNGRVCGRHYEIHMYGYCGCRYHENYSYALQALNDLQ